MKPYYSLSDFPDRKSAGKNFVAVCPKCGTPHLSISKAKGVYHCFYAGCNFNGILTDFCKADRPHVPAICRGSCRICPDPQRQQIQDRPKRRSKHVGRSAHAALGLQAP